ncbi:MAG: sugar transferase [Acidimicrobiales bacterium]|nr:sugar transferase [Acidimicrobiales bacterium]
MAIAEVEHLEEMSTDQLSQAAPARDHRPVLNPKLALGGADIAVVAIATALTALSLRSGMGVSRTHDAMGFFVVAMACLPLWLVIFSSQRLFNIRFIGRRLDEIRRIVNASFLGAMAIALAGYFAGIEIPRRAILTLFLVVAVLVSIEREVARRIFHALRARGRLVRNVVIAGCNSEGRELAAMLRAEPWLGYSVLGFVDDSATEPEPVPGVPLLGTIADAGDIVRARTGASVIVAASAIESATTNRLARDLLDAGIHVELSSTLRDIASQRLVVRPLGRFPVVYVEPVQRDGWRRTAKRVFDVTVASILLLISSPVVLVAMIAIRLDSSGPALFRQGRVGRNNRPFEVLKLRTMVEDAEEMRDDLLDENEADGPLFKMKDDPRVTRVGRILRSTSIDELPQLWNVVRGEMSLVGPRPALPHETEAWDPLLTQRLRVKPGITGMWQVNGRSESSFEDYTRLDLYYVDNWSLLIDLAIMAKTIPVVLMRQGAH